MVVAAAFNKVFAAADRSAEGSEQRELEPMINAIEASAKQLSKELSAASGSSFCAAFESRSLNGHWSASPTTSRRCPPRT